MITVTEEAVNQLRAMLEEKGFAPDGYGLRLAVEKGGCAGMQYTMRLAPPVPGDEIVLAGDVRFIIDQASLRFLEGSQIDYEDSLNDSGFKIHNPNAARSCGCGTSFEVGA
ncbi:MAG: iron-sulfur cluster assembly protein [Verrucomicrobia bacterium]|jgi:iron-sulfur cluster assembly protein|nr:MAG: iron-sulfur cluster assembly protein [Verrucomicrobiota bacterium]